MPEALGSLVAFLAVLGVVGLLRRLARSGVRLMLLAAEVTVEAGSAEISARRGDITGMTERRAAERRARRARRRDSLLLALWLAWLALPPFTAWPAAAYALAAPLWLLPSPPLRPRPVPPPDPER